MAFLARFKEASTWGALAGALAALGINIPSPTWQAISTVGSLAAGAAGVLIKEKG